MPLHLRMFTEYGLMIPGMVGLDSSGKISEDSHLCFPVVSDSLGLK